MAIDTEPTQETGEWPTTASVNRWEYQSGRCPMASPACGDPVLTERLKCPEPLLCAIDRAAKYLGGPRFVVIDTQGYTATGTDERPR